MPKETNPNRRVQAYKVPAALKLKLTSDAEKREQSESCAVIHVISCYYEPEEWVRNFIRQQAAAAGKTEKELMAVILKSWAEANGAAPPQNPSKLSSTEREQIQNLARDPEKATQIFQALIAAIGGNIKMLLPSFGL